MITIIFAPPGFGKTCFLTHCLNQIMFDCTRNLAMQQEILQKRQNGFKNLRTVPLHCVSANYAVTGFRFRCSPRHSRLINPYRLGFENKFVKTHFNLPHEAIGITEAQKYLNSRMSMYFPRWQSSWYEEHRHDDLDIFLDTQRPMLIDINIRELARFVEIVKLDLQYDKSGNVTSLVWTIREIENASLFDRYMQSGKKDTFCYTERQVVANYNVFKCYDSQSCKPKFYAGHFDEDFDLNYTTPTQENIQGYIDYLHQNDDELPENFYQKRSN